MRCDDKRYDNFYITAPYKKNLILIFAQFQKIIAAARVERYH
jgi:hypothetical protein